MDGSSAAAARWGDAYRHGWAPWDIGRPQPVFVTLADAGEISAPVLDSGCGTGEQSLMLAGRGLEVVGVDISRTAVETARSKAADRGLDVRFVIGDVLALERLGLADPFATIVDSGTFHTFGDEDRARYVDSLASVIKPGGVVHLLCFSELTPGTAGPRRVTQADLRTAFADGWTIERIDSARFDVDASFSGDRPYAWLARIARTG